MSRHDDAVRLKHMLDHAREAVALVDGKTPQDIEFDRVTQLALTRLLEIVGEAAGRISVEGRTALPGIPWAQIVGLRNRLIHGYDSVDIAILWEILTGDLPPLVERLEFALSAMEQD